jgi:hypothetical protein
LRQIRWLAIPYDKEDIRGALIRRFKVASVPTCLLFRRNPLQGNAFELMHRGRNCCELLEDPASLASYPWQLVHPLTETTVRCELPGSVAFVVLCEHLTPTSFESVQLHRTLEQLGATLSASLKAHQRLKFVVAPGPPTALSRRFRAEARLPEAGRGSETLQMVLVDQRWPQRPHSARYLVRAICEHEAIPYSLEGLLSDGGKRIAAVIAIYFDAIEPGDVPTRHAPDSFYHKPPIREPWSLTL